MMDHETALMRSRQLHLQADCLHVLTLAPYDALPKPRMIRLLRHELVLLQKNIHEHFASEEQGGYLAGVLRKRPDLARRLVDLQRQHVMMRDDLAELVEQTAGDAELGTLSERIAGLVEMLEAHEHAEHELIAGALEPVEQPEFVGSRAKRSA